jgi:hypothetical protein
MAAVEPMKNQKNSSAVGDDSAAPRIIVRIELTPAAKAAYARVAERTGRTQISTTSRLMEWFSHQSPGLQAAILGQYPDDMQTDIARMLLDRLPKPAATAGSSRKS